MGLVQKKKKKPAEKADGEAAPPAAAKLTVFQKALMRDGGWNKESFPEFPEAVYWVRQIIALVCGVAWGILPLRGMMGIVLFVSANLAGTFTYYNKWCAVDEDDYGQVILMQEGLWTSVGLFLITWIFIFTLFHPSGESPPGPAPPPGW